MKTTKLKKLIDDADSICFLTGAGVSTLSGIPDFQDTDKIWKHPVPREVAISRMFFNAYPEEFWKIYREAFKTKQQADPNGVHNWISSLQETKKVTVITQNVDELHQKSGTENVLTVHGNIRENLCLKCKFITPDDGFTELPLCETCELPLKPNVVLFGERPRFGAESEQAMYGCDLFIVMGTSLKVFPVANLPKVLRMSRPNVPQVWINKDLHPLDFPFELAIFDEYSDFLENFGKQ